MPKLNQILAIEKGTKQEANRVITELHRTTQKEPLLAGISRTYRPIDEDGEQFPPEQTRVQLRLADALGHASGVWKTLWDLTATKDIANYSARADVVVNGTTLAKDVPAIHLLWLEKQLVDVHTFISKLPALPQSEDWTWDENQNCYRTEPTDTTKQKKLPRAFVKYEATEHHPAQVDTVHEDKVMGYWRTVKYSGALPAQRIATLRVRVEELLRAVKFAREAANQEQAEQQKIAAPLLDYIFAT